MGKMKVRSRHNISAKDIKKILVRATNWVGDTVMMIPSLAALKKKFPNARITALASPWVIPLLENHPCVDRTMIIDKGKGFFSRCKELTRIISWIRREDFDLAVLFQNAFEAAFLTFLGRIRYIVGYNTDGRGLFLTHKVIRDEDILSVHQVEYYLRLVETLGCQVEDRKPDLYLNDEDSKYARSMISSLSIEENSFVLGLNPGAVYGSAKRWPEDRFAAIGDLAAGRWNARVLIFGAFSEKEIGDRVSGYMHAAPVNLCGKTTLGQAMALIKRCNLFVTNDSGLMHIAAAFDIPLIAIFGPTDCTTTGPYSKNSRIVRHDIDCSPCLKEACPQDHRCMLSIEPEEVWEEMESLKTEVSSEAGSIC
jgi:heptosyltransferase-2